MMISFHRTQACVLGIAGLTLVGWMTFAQRQEAVPGQGAVGTSDASNYTAAPIGAGSGSQAASSASSNGMGEGGISGLSGIFGEDIGGGGTVFRAIKRGMFSMDDGLGNNALIIASSYERFNPVDFRAVNVLRIHSLNADTGAILWTTDLVQSAANQ